MKNTTFDPDEIIFAVTDKCNLKCAHCFVERKNFSLDAEKAKKLIENGSKMNNLEKGYFDILHERHETLHSDHLKRNRGIKP